jgi:hypothetical protein
VSNPRLSPSPIAVLPTRGFYRSEFDARKRPFNWLRDEGILEVFTPKLDITRVWLRFEARSVDADRPVIISGGEVTKRVVAPGGDRSGELSAGPFALRDGRLRITVRSEIPPRRFGADPRPLSVRFARLWASPSAPPPAGR